MRTVFEILPTSSFDAVNCTLFCEVSNEGFAYCIKDEVANSFIGLAIYHYDMSKFPVGLPIDLQIVFHQNEILSQKFKNIFVVYSFPQSILVPFTLYDSEKNSLLMNLMHGDLHEHETILTDVVAEESVYNCYRIPNGISEVIQNQYPEAVCTHQYSLLLKKTVEDKNKLQVIFYAKKLIVILILNGKHQLIQSFDYRTPEDVSYILLNICHQFQISSINVEISGLLEENSALYKEIYKFFMDIEFTKLPDEANYSEEIKQFPSHYFSYIFALNSCV